MTPPISLSSKVRQADNLVSCDLDGETALMNATTGYYYGLDPVGSHIWSLIGEGRLVAEVCALLLEEYEVEPIECQRQVLAYLSELAQNNLVEVDNKSPR